MLWHTPGAAAGACPRRRPPCAPRRPGSRARLTERCTFVYRHAFASAARGCHALFVGWQRRAASSRLRLRPGCVGKRSICGAQLRAHRHARVPCAAAVVMMAPAPGMVYAAPHGAVPVAHPGYAAAPAYVRASALSEAALSSHSSGAGLRRARPQRGRRLLHGRRLPAAGLRGGTRDRRLRSGTRLRVPCRGERLPRRSGRRVRGTARSGIRASRSWLRSAAGVRCPTGAAAGECGHMRAGARSLRDRAARRIYVRRPAAPRREPRPATGACTAVAPASAAADVCARWGAGTLRKRAVQPGRPAGRRVHCLAHR